MRITRSSVDEVNLKTEILAQHGLVLCYQVGDNGFPSSRFLQVRRLLLRWLGRSRSIAEVSERLATY